MIAGGLLGGLLGGGTQSDIWWGVGGGFALGMIGMGALLWGFERIRSG